MPSNTSNRIDALPIGTKLHGYVIERALGHGGFGIVYLAKHLELGARVAIKEYMPSVLAIRRGSSVRPTSTATVEHYDEGLQRFGDEARQLVRFENHPNVVSCRDFFRDNGTAYLVMDHVDGLTLAELLGRREQQGRPFDESELMAVARPLLEGLQAVHSAGVLHRDIKPTNIIVRRSDERPVLIDFGAAKHFIAEHSVSMAPYTEGYAATEQISEGGQLGPWTDLYALGGVLWRIVAGGNPPWADPRWSELNWKPPNPLRVEIRMQAIGRGLADPLPSAREVGKGRFSELTLGAIDRCLELWEEDRVQHSRQLKEMLLLNVPKSDTDEFTAHHEPPHSRDGSTTEVNKPSRSPDRAGHSNARYSTDASSVPCKSDRLEETICRPVNDNFSEEDKHRNTGRDGNLISRKNRYLPKLLLGLLALFLYGIGSDFWFEVEFPLSGFLHLGSMVLLYVMFFHWGRTKYLSLPFEAHKKQQFRSRLLACAWFASGLIYIVLTVLIVQLSEIDYSQVDFSTKYEHSALFFISLIWVILGVICIVCSIGIILKQLWSIQIAIFISFAVADTVWGLLTACYTWWITSSTDTESTIGKEMVGSGESVQRHNAESGID